MYSDDFSERHKINDLPLKTQRLDLTECDIHNLEHHQHDGGNGKGPVDLAGFEKRVGGVLTPRR